ncbi:chromate transporter, partial [Mycobacterium tuberculosis]|nr:chromate transporter [Mycobacterium tuberculosis]
LLHGLKLVAVAVVAQAVFGMTRSLTPDRSRAAIALVAVAMVVFVGGGFAQIGAIALGALAGLVWCRGNGAAAPGRLPVPISRRLGIAMLTLFALVLVVTTVAAEVAANTEGGQAVRLFSAFYNAGTLVFGGGHVVLPLLETRVVTRGWV